MHLVMAEDATSEQVEEVTVTLRQNGLEPALVPGGRSPRISLAGGRGRVESLRLELMPGVLRIIDPSHPFKKASWEHRNAPTVVELPHGVRIGGDDFVVMAGASPYDAQASLADVAGGARAAGATLLHGGVFGPRGGPHSHSWDGAHALRALARVRAETGMALVVEAADLESARVLADHVDVLQVGPDDMQNFPLLRQVGRLGKPVMLVRGPVGTITELLQAAEYILAEGNADAILCEAGVLHPSSEGRRVLDLSAVPVIKSLSHLPVVVAPGGPDPRATAALACAAVAAGADGVMLEVRSTPGQPAESPALDAAAFADVVRQLRPLAAAVGRRFPPAAGESAAGEPARPA